MILLLSVVEASLGAALRVGGWAEVGVGGQAKVGVWDGGGGDGDEDRDGALAVLSVPVLSRCAGLEGRISGGLHISYVFLPCGV